MTAYWLSSERMTILAVVENGILIETAPIARKFIGQPPERLGEWLRAQGGFRWAVIR